MAARVAEMRLREMFRQMVTVSLRELPQGRYVQADYWGLAHPTPVDPRTGDEIAADVVGRLGLEVTD